MHYVVRWDSVCMVLHACMTYVACLCYMYVGYMIVHMLCNVM